MEKQVKYYFLFRDGSTAYLTFERHQWYNVPTHYRNNTLSEWKPIKELYN